MDYYLLIHLNMNFDLNLSKTSKYALVALLLFSGEAGFSVDSSLAKADSARRCAKFLSGETGIELSQITDTQRAFFEFEDKGFHIAFELAPKEGSRNEVELAYFVLDYDPIQFLPGSFFRRVLGKQPMQYSAEDIRYFSQNTIYMREGRVLEFYLRLPTDRNKEIDEGPLLAVSLETGKVIGFPARTNVDAAVEGMRRGAIGGILSFANGLSIEAQNAFKNPKGQWYLGEGVDGATRAIEAPSYRVLEEQKED
ncbi:MAG: hypothetical protein KDD40_04520 [Bdellovibrionales bacterium]|nr:hypothetical protein [Bdellovibrionales bacterium]